MAIPVLAPGLALADPHQKRRRGIEVTIRDPMLLSTGVDNIAEGLKMFGINGVEMAVGRDYMMNAILPTDDRRKLHLDQDDDVKRLADQLATSGTHITAFLIGNNFNARDIAGELAWVVRVVQVANTLGVPAIRIDAIMEGGDRIPVDQRQDIFARCVNHILMNTEGVPVDLGIENHGTQGNNPDFLLGLINRVGSTRLGVNMDIGNFYWAGYPISELYVILKKLAPYTKHTHVKNINYPADVRDKRREPGWEYGKYVCPIPQGDIDIKKVVGFLKAAGYKRDLCIEDESLGKFDQETRRKHVQEAVAYLKKAAA
jgi:sugar phosphate isomerase/epimerase